MDCKESLSLMSAAVDGELREPKLSEFLEHIRICEACRAEFEAEKATKAILKNRLKRVKAPQSLVDAIKRQTMGNPSISQFSQMASSTEAMFQSKAILNHGMCCFQTGYSLTPTPIGVPILFLPPD
jgi:anti-sigma factor RsiW